MSTSPISRRSVKTLISEMKYFEASNTFLSEYLSNCSGSGGGIGHSASSLNLAISCAVLETKLIHRNNIKSLWQRLHDLTSSGSVGGIVEELKTILSLQLFIIDAFSKGKLIKLSDNPWYLSKSSIDLSDIVKFIRDSLMASTEEPPVVEETKIYEAIYVHNIIAVSKLYQNIYIDDLARLLGSSSGIIEKLVAKLINEKFVDATIDKLDGASSSRGGLINFTGNSSGSADFNDSLFQLCSAVTDCCELSREPPAHAYTPNESKSDNRRTLVIHPMDPSTDFLCNIYSGIPNKTVVREGVDKSGLIQLIKEHDRVMMMGHGLPDGLLSLGLFKGCGFFAIDESVVQLLKEKIDNVFIWCYAARFVERHGLGGYYSDMFISEVGESQQCSLDRQLDHSLRKKLAVVDQSDVDESNNRFVDIIAKYIHLDKREIYQKVKEEYGKIARENPIAMYNNERLGFH
jgi:hypothetical protein